MKKLLWVALGLAAVSSLCAYTVLARLPSNQSGARGIYIQFDNVFDNLDRVNGYPVAGGHMRWEWKDLEPGYDGDHRFDSEIRVFVSQQASRGKKAAIGIETFVGRINQSPPYGSLGVPQWLWETYSGVAVWNPRGSAPYWYALDYLDTDYQRKYQEFVNAFADWLAANPDVAANIAWVEIGVGMYSETQPSDQWVTANWADYVFYADDPPINLGYSDTDWSAYVNWCTDVYDNAFRARNPSLSHIALFLNCAPDFKATRTAFTDYAAAKSVGLKNNGLQVDRHPYYLYGPLENWGSVVATHDVPIAWETYEQWLTNETELYWGLLCALDKFPDVMEPDRWLMVDHNKNPRPNYIAIWNWVEPYVGVSQYTTPGIWCAMRETEFPANGEPGNFDFWLFQREDLAGGQTVAAWNVTGFKEGRYTRRTDQGTGNPYMHFQVLNPSAFYLSPGVVTVKVTYLDQGTDLWKLTYDSTTGEKEAGTIQKTNTNTWKVVSHVLTDARFGNGFGPGGVGTAPDIKVDCLNDGNEYVHKVEVVRDSPAVTPTPTVTSSACSIQGSVDLQGRPSPPNSAWSIPLTVTVGAASYSVSTDLYGDFSLPGLTPGTYSIRVKNHHTLSNLKSGVTLVTGANAVDLGELQEGDADDNNCVNITDFSVLASNFLGYDARADFNEDGLVNITDFSLLATNFGECGDVPVTAPSKYGEGAHSGALTAAEGTVQVSIEPQSSEAEEDEVFSVAIQVAAGSQPVDGVEVHVDFDPQYLQVVDDEGNPSAAIEDNQVLDWVLLNHADNVGGEIDFAAGTLPPELPDGTFSVATVRFKALQATDESGTAVAYVTRNGNPTNVTYQGSSVLAGTSDGLVTVAASSTPAYDIYLPVISR